MGGFGYSVADLGLRAGAPVVVYGIGGSGKVVRDVLLEAGLPVIVAVDSGEGVRPNEVDLAEVQAVVKSPGIAMNVPLVQRAVAAGVPVLGEIDLWWRARRDDGCRVIGITGTNGKSTVTALVAHILRSAGFEAAEGGNLGVPALALPRLGAGGFYVLELSSYQTEMMQDLRLDAAVLTNLTPDHLARHGDMAGYLAAKLRMFEVGARREVRGAREALRPVVGDVGLREAIAGVVGNEVIVADVGMVAGHEVGALVGPHNAQNIACAWELVKPWVGEADFWRGVASFRPLAHRMEMVGERRKAKGGRILFVNDSKATNGDSAVWALRSFKNIIWICGGQPKSDGLGTVVSCQLSVVSNVGGVGFVPEPLKEVRVALTIGEAGEDFARVLREKGVPQVEVCGTLEVAVARAYEIACAMEGESVVLLSPAAASWDQYASFEVRGEHFRQEIERLRD